MNQTPITIVQTVKDQQIRFNLNYARLLGVLRIIIIVRSSANFDCEEKN